MFSANASQVSNDVKYIEDFCSVYLRTGTGSSQTVTTGVKENTGALVISKSRSAATDWAWYDTFRGATKELASNTTAAQITQSQGLTSFNTDGHTWGTLAKVNTSGATYVDFVLKPTPKFFDVVTYTGTGSAQNIAHNLGSVPGCIIVKSTSTVNDWRVYHRSLATVDSALRLNSTAAVGSSSTFWNSTAPTSTQFTVGSDGSVNANGATYVAYLFAHNAGGFGLTGTDNVISCGSFTTDGSGNATVNLGYEPQYLLIKRTDSTSSWLMFDTMRELSLTGRNYLYANTSGAEVAESGNYLPVTATGFQWLAWAGASVQTWAYIAIRRGPMKTPTSGNQVFSAQSFSDYDANVYTDIVTDFVINKVTYYNPDLATYTTGGNYMSPRLMGLLALQTNSTGTESGTSSPATWAVQTGFGWANGSGYNIFNWSFRRAPGFADVVCYTGTGSTTTFNHNLGVAPELLIVKARNLSAQNWAVGSSRLPDWENRLWLNLTDARAANNSVFNSTAPTASVFTVGTNTATNNSGSTYVAYLFASCPGVQSIQSYVGDGTTGRTINCGFTGGARFVCIKATSTTGSWWTFDSARGITTNADPVLQLNSTAAEITSADAIDPAASGFIVNQEATCSLNASGVSYLVWAIA